MEVQLPRRYGRAPSYHLGSKKRRQKHEMQYTTYVVVVNGKRRLARQTYMHTHIYI